MAIGAQAPGRYHVGGVTSLQYVSGTDGLGALDDHPLVSALQYGFLAMGVACLLGVDRKKARWVGVAGVGFGLLRR